MARGESDRLIGASEFCATLNSDSSSPNAVYYALKRFARTARQQRLPNEEISGDDASEEEEEEEKETQQDEPPTKKYRKDESWKEDTASYNVPFVGTSVAIGLDAVVPGEWPTGLMKAYLNKSPLAVELTGDTFFPGSRLYASLSKKTVKKSQRQLPRKLLKVYLKALSELLAAEDTSSRMLPLLLRNRLDNMLKLLRQNAASVLPVLVRLAALAPRDLARGIEPYLDPRMTRILGKEDWFWDLIAEFVKCDDPVVRSCLLTPLKGALQGLHQSPASLVLVEALEERFSDYRGSISRIMSKDCLQSLCRQAVKTETAAITLLVKCLATDSPLWRTHETHLIRSVVYLIDNGNKTIWQLAFPIVLSKPGLDADVMDNVSALPDPSKSIMSFCSKAQRLNQLLRTFPTLAPRKLNRQVMNKGLQSKNALVVYQTIVLSISLLDTRESVSPDFLDIGTVLVVLGKLDLKAKPSIVVSALGCKLVSRYLAVSRDMSLDWSKALSGAFFGRMPVVLQKTVLEAMETCIKAGTPRPQVAFSAFTRSFQMLCVTRPMKLYNLLRDVTSRLLVEASGCTTYEATLWVDGLGADMLEDFCTLMQKVQNQQPQIVTIARAWKEVGLEGFPLQDDLPSRLLCCAIESQSKSERFNELIVKIATHCLLRSLRPLGLAALIQSKSGANQEDPESFRSLADYSRCLVSMGEYTGARRWELVCLLLREVLSERAVLSSVLLPQKDSLSLSSLRKIDHQALVYQLSHLSLVLEHPQDKRCTDFMTTLLPLAYLGSECNSWVAGDSALTSLLSGSQFLATKLLAISGSNRDSADLRIEESNASKLLSFVVPDYLSYAAKLVVMGRLFDGFLQAIDTSGSASEAKLLFFMSRLDENMHLDQIRCSTLSHCLGKALDSFIALSKKPEPSAQARKLLQLIGSFILGALQQRREAVLVVFRQDPIQIVVSCLRSMLYTSETNYAILTELVTQCDTDVSLVVLNMLAKNSDNQWNEKFVDQGNLDNALLLAAESVLQERGDLSALSALYATVERRCLVPYSPQSQMTSGFLALLKFSVQDHVSPTTQFQQTVGEFLLVTTEQFGEFSDTIKLSVISVVIALCSRESLSSSTTRALLGRSIELLLRLLPQAIRKSSNSRSTSTDFITEECVEVLQNVLEKFSFDQADASSLCSINPVIRACVKYGMRWLQTNETLALGNRCIRIIRVTLDAVQSGNLPAICFSESPEKTFESMLFGMVVSHSCFRRVLSNREPEHHGVQVTILEILIACMNKDLRFGGFDEDMWDSLMLSFDATVSKRDSMILQFLRMYAERAEATGKSFRFSLTTWGPQPGDGSNIVFPENVDARRVRSTITNFPKGDSLTFEGADRLESRKIQDIRYSPAFLLPLMLSALQTAAISLRNNEPANAIHLVRIFQERGMVGLCLASLSCDCHRVREIAVSAMGLMEFIVDSQEARRTSIWRDRPQLALIFRSTHKALTIKVSDERDQGDTWRASVPQLPGLSAIFLAKAASILSRPGDPLFPAVNRCFLQNEQEGGAFAHLGRLPIFVSLFCSAEINRVQLTDQRHFAMHLIQDGMMTEDCYRLLTACYAPELLLSSIQSRPEMSVHESDSETTLLLQTLRKILQVGGERASTHLINKLGLISWLRSLFPELAGGSVLVRSAALHLVRDALKISRTQLATPHFLLAARGMAQAAMMVSIGAALVPPTDRLVVCEIVEHFKSQEEDPDLDYDELQCSVATQFLSNATQESAEQIAAIVCICSFRLRYESEHEMRTLCQEIIDGSRWSDDPQVAAAVLDQVSRCAEVVRGEPKLLTVLLEYLVEWRQSCFGHVASRNSWWKCIGALVPEPSENGLAALCFAARRSELEMEE